MCIVMFLAVSMVSQAQNNKEYETAMVKMLEVSKSMEAIKQISPQIIASIKQQGGTDLPDAFWQELEKGMSTMYDKILKAMIPIYEKYLTLEDINGIIKFYETPVGKKLADSNTKIALESMPIAQQIAMDTMQEFLQKMNEIKNKK